MTTSGKASLPPERSFRQGRLILQKKLHFGPRQKREAILLYDKILERKFAPLIRSFPRRYALVSGEGLKDLAIFPKHMAHILKLADGLSKSELHIVALGGGSVGDFAGFVASVLKRGVPLVQIPSTWLAAVDSAHGGKTALNVQGYKNQVGTFWPARQIVLAQDLLLSQPPERLTDSYAEILKIALLSGKSLWKKVVAVEPTGSAVWALLPALIAAKWDVVARDPFESSGLREILNLGHTLGHVFEKEKKWPHGKAVLYGMRFAVDYSEKLGLAKGPWLAELREHALWPADADFRDALRRLKAWKGGLQKDKKAASGGQVRFILLESPGQPVVKALSFSAIGAEIERQGR